jgi:hypothetical protein
MFQFFPLKLQIYLVQNFDLGWFQKTSDRARAKDLVSSIQLLSRQQLSDLFPEADIAEERFAALVKSFVAIKV